MLMLPFWFHLFPHHQLVVESTGLKNGSCSCLMGRVFYIKKNFSLMPACLVLVSHLRLLPRTIFPVSSLGLGKLFFVPACLVQQRADSRAHFFLRPVIASRPRKN